MEWIWDSQSDSRQFVFVPVNVTLIVITGHTLGRAHSTTVCRDRGNEAKHNICDLILVSTSEKFRCAN